MKKLILIVSLLLSGLANANPPGTFQPLLLSNNPIGAPSSLGSTISAAGNTDTCVITTTAAIQSGNLVVVFVQIPSNVFRTVSSVSDGVNSYSLAVAQNDSVNFDAEIWYKENAAAVATSATLTVTFSGSTTGSNGYGCEAAQVSGILPSGSLDKTNSNNTTTATPSVTTAALSQSNEIAFGMAFSNGGTRTYTEAVNFTNLFNLLAGAATRTGSGYQKVSTASAITYSPVFSGSSQTQTVIATFKGF